MKRKILLMLVALLLVAVTVAACSKEPEDTETPEQTTAETTALTTNKDGDEKEPKTVSVEYYNGNELLKTDTIELGSEYAVSYTPDAPAGHNFSGWKYENGENCESKIKPTEKVRLYAAFTANTYKVTYNADGGEVEGADTEVTYGQSFTLALPTRDSFLFDGWFDGATRITDGEGKSLEAWTFLSDKELTASWLPPRALSLTTADSAAGSVSGAGSYYEGQSVTATATPNLGYKFLGWYDGEDVVSEDIVYTFTITFCDRAYEARWAVSEEISAFEFTSGTDTCVVTGVKDKTVSELYVPSFVTEIADGAFEGCAATIFSEYNGGKYRGNAENLYHTLYEITDKTITSFEIPASTKVLGKDLFLGCEALAEINLPIGLESIGEAAFHGCISLREITIPEGVTAISMYSFANCSSLERVTFSSTLTNIGSFAFNGCVKLQSIELPVTLEKIGVWAFQKCDMLKSVTFGNTEGWVAGIDPVDSVELSDAETAANYLTTKKHTALWMRKS